MIISLLPYYQLHDSIMTLQHLQDKPIMFLNESTLTKEKIFPTTAQVNAVMHLVTFELAELLFNQL